MPGQNIRTITAGATFKRSIGYLSDGSIVVAIYDSSNNTAYLYHSVNRTTWTLKWSTTSMAGAGQVVIDLSMIIDKADNIHIAWTNTLSSGRCGGWYKKYNYTGSYSWTPAPTEEVWPSYNGLTLSNIDLAITDQGWVSIIAREIDSSWSPGYTRIRIMRDTNAGWVSHIVWQVEGYSRWGFQGGFVTALADPRGPGGSTQAVLFVWSVGEGMTVSSRHMNINNSDGNLAKQFEYGITGTIRDQDEGVLMPVTDETEPESWWTAVLVYTDTSSSMQSRVYRFPKGDYSSVGGGVFQASFFEPAAWSNPSPVSVAIVKGPSGSFADAAGDARIVALGGNTPSPAVIGKVLPWFPPYQWSSWHRWGSGSTSPNAGYRDASNGAIRNHPNTTVDVLLLKAGVSAPAIFMWNEPPDPAYSVQPAADTTVATSRPDVSAVLGAVETGISSVRGEWQIADDSAFTLNVKNILEPWTDFRLRSTARVSEPFPTTDRITQGTKYIRARTEDVLGGQSAWSPSHTFNVVHLPTTQSHEPKGGLVLPYQGSVALKWVFSDTDPSDSQTAYEVEVSRNATGVVLHTTGKVLSTAQSGSVTIDPAEKNQVLRWRVRVWDVDNVAGPWSDYMLFELVDGPIVEILTPGPDEVVTTGQPTLSWTYTSPTGRPQRAFRGTLTNVATGEVIYRTEWITSSATQVTLPSSATLSNLTSYRVKLEVRDSASMEGSDTQNFSTQWVPPDSVPFTVDADIFEQEGYVGINWNSSTRDLLFVEYRVYRKDLVTGETTLIHTSDTSAERYSIRDWLVKSRHPYSYNVVQVGERFGSLIESSGDTAVTVEPWTTYYWLIHPDSPAAERHNVRLIQVVDDSFTEEYERETFHLIGRGRKADVGDRIGFTGTLSCQVWNVPEQSAREHRLQLEALRATRREVYLRNPFGDMWQVSTGDIDITRVGGLGHREHHDATIPYEEVT